MCAEKLVNRLLDSLEVLKGRIYFGNNLNDDLRSKQRSGLFKKFMSIIQAKQKFQIVNRLKFP